MSYKLQITLGAAVIAITAFAIVIMFSPQIKASASPLATVIGAATTTATFSVNTSTRVLATTTSITGTSYTRVYATICTVSATPVGINLDADKATNAATGNVTSFIAAAAGYSACYEITDRNAYMGSITASSTSGAAVAITVKDYVQ